MKKIEKLSKDEIKDLKLTFTSLERLFTENKYEFELFKAAPVTYLRKSGLKVMNYINNRDNPSTVSRFSTSIRHFLRNNMVFNKCSWCKILALTIMYSLCGKVRLSIDAIYGAISSLIEILEEVLNLSKELSNKLIKELKLLNRRISPFQMALFLCERIGLC